MRWRLLVHGPDTPARNMALDEALLRCTQEPVLRIYQWSEPAVSIGYFQSRSVVPPGRVFIRRYTGGGLVDHSQDVTYTIVAPKAHPFAQLSTCESYSKIHEALLPALHELGLGDALLTPCSTSEEDHPACFQKPVRSDILLGTQKLAGAAQRRGRDGLLHQGSILLPDPSQNDRLRELLAQAMAQAWKANFAASECSPQELAKAEELVLSRYGTDAWNLQR